MLWDRGCGAGRGGAGELALGERPGRAGCWAGCWAAREVVAGPAGGRGEALGQAGIQAGLV